MELLYYETALPAGFPSPALDYMEERIDLSRELIRHPLSTFIVDPKAEDTVVSKGVINLPAVLAELKRQNFSGMLSIEHESNWYHNLPDVIFTRNYYDSLVQKLQ